MDLQIELIHEYNEVLIGRKAVIPAFFFGQTEKEAEEAAIIICKYAFNKYLGWGPYELRDGLTAEIIDKLKLKPVIKYIPFPPEFDRNKDFFYVVWRMYPKTANISLNEQVLKIYRMVLDGELAKFPKEYFSGNEGRIKACICLNYMVSEYMNFDSIDELYAIFASSAINKYLQEYRLTSLCKSLFLNSVDYLHTMLPDAQKNDFLYYFYSFEIEYAEKEKKEKKQMKKEKLSKKKKGDSV